MESLELKTEKDPETGEALGALPNPSFINSETATRSHAGVAYWEPISGRTNLILKQGAIVEKVIFGKDLSPDGSLIATGVQYSIDGSPHISHASQEIIICAGAFNSPALLEISGIGPPTLLEKLGIDVLIPNASIGEILQDHPLAFLSVEISDPDQSLDALRIPGNLEAAAKQYAESKSGVFASSFNAMATLSAMSVLSPEDLTTMKSLVDKSDTPLSPA